MRVQEAFDFRLDHLFAEAIRLATNDIARIKAAAAANGSLLSGATQKEIVRAIAERANAAAIEALVGLDRRHMSSRRRSHLQEVLKDRVEQFVTEEARWLVQPLAEGSAEEQRVHGLLSEAAGRLRSTIDQHRTGFTEAAPKGWVQAHPQWAFWIPNILAVVAIAAALLR